MSDRWNLQQHADGMARADRRAARRFLSVSVSALALAALAGPVSAQSVWTGAIDGDWFKAGNWNPAAPPANGVRIDTAGPGAVIDGGPPVVLNGYVGVGESAGANGSLTIRNGGALASVRGLIAQGTGATGAVTVDGSTWTIAETLLVGGAGNGKLDILNGGVVTSVHAEIGSEKDSVGVLTVDGAGSRWTNAAAMHVGVSGNGTLNIHNGGMVELRDATIGTFKESLGVVTVDGPGSILKSSSFLRVGHNGSGTLNILNGGTVEIGDAEIGVSKESLGVVTVDGPGSILKSTTFLQVGDNGSGTLTILNGGAVENRDSTVGYRSGSVGVATVDGAGSRWTNTGYLNVGGLGQGTLTIRNGGAVESLAGYVGTFEGSVGLVTVDGAGSRWTSMQFVSVGHEGAGTLNILNGGQVSSAYGWIGGDQTGVGVVTVDGVGSAWTMNGRLDVGDEGHGTLNIRNGGVVANEAGKIGVEAGSVGIVTVDGAGSHWMNSDRLDIGGNGNGTLNILNGGLVTNTTGIIGLDAGAVGVVTVDGAGSRWVNGSFVDVGSFGHGTLTIRHGGEVTNTGGAVGLAAGSVGVATVDGAGSRWTNSQQLVVGAIGNGTLSILNGGTVSSAQGVIAEAVGAVGVVTVDGQGSRWTSGVALDVGVSGDGTLTVRNGGTVSVSDGIAIATVAGSRGTLNIGAAAGDAPAAPGTVDAAIVAFGLGQGTLNFNHTGTAYTFAPELRGLGTLNQLAGTTILSADSSSFTGPTNVSGGSLIVNGSLAGSAVTITGGMLGGNGTVGTVVANAGGMVSPGNSIGTLNVAGDILFNAGSLYGVEFDRNTSDRIVATGTATLAGGAVTVLKGPEPYVLGARYTILTAAGGVTGTFAGVSPQAALPFLSFGLSYEPTSVSLDVSRSAVTFASVGLTPNQVATGGGADSLALTSPLITALVQLDRPQARAAFDRLSGEVHASTRSAMLDDSRFVREAALDRLRAAFDSVGAASAPVMAYQGGKAMPAPANTGRFALWARGFGSWGQWDGDGNAATLRRDIGGAFVGGDAFIADWRVGLLGGYSRTSFKVNERASSGTSDNYHVGLYGGTQWGSLAFRSGVAATWQDIAVNRSVAFPGFFENLAAGYDARTTQAFGELANGTRVGRFGLEPFANLAYVNLSTDGFTEHGGVAALRSASTTDDATFTTLGLRAATDIAFHNGVLMTARGTLGWRHAFGDVTPGATFLFAGGSPFSIAGVPIARDAAVVEAGLDWNLGANAALGIAYGGQFGSDATDQSVRANVNVRF